ncbi:hypothetical protein BC831DRAFT_474703 [Entophlyctis helioformis]|nr:hypothetical protein BC831DRAFT_474703 [Entophlyctis helioformis]
MCRSSCECQHRRRRRRRRRRRCRSLQRGPDSNSHGILVRRNRHVHVCRSCMPCAAACRRLGHHNHSRSQARCRSARVLVVVTSTATGVCCRIVVVVGRLAIICRQHLDISAMVPRPAASRARPCKRRMPPLDRLNGRAVVAAHAIVSGLGLLSCLWPVVVPQHKERVDDRCIQPQKHDETRAVRKVRTNWVGKIALADSVDVAACLSAQRHHAAGKDDHKERLDDRMEPQTEPEVRQAFDLEQHARKLKGSQQPSDDIERWLNRPHEAVGQNRIRRQRSEGEAGCHGYPPQSLGREPILHRCGCWRGCRCPDRR